MTLVWSPTTDQLYAVGNSSPSLDLDFATNKTLNDNISGDNLVTFTRASIGTYVDSSGIIQTAAIDAPRFDHDPVTGESLGLLVEEERENLIPSSEDVDYASYHRSEITTSLDVATVTAPDGTTTADEIAPTAITSEHFIGYPVNVTSGTTYTLSAYVKPNGTDSVRIRFAFAGFNNENGFHVFSTNTTTSGSCDFKITPVANGWYRIQGTAVASSTALGQLRIYPKNLNSWLGVPSEGLYVWGAQLEEGSFTTSYIPTDGSTVTRAADVAEITGTNFSSWYNQSEGTMFVDCEVIGDNGTNQFIYSISDGALNDEIRAFKTSGNNALSTGVEDSVNGTTNNQFGNTNTPFGVPFKLAHGVASDNTTRAINGIVDTPDTTVTMPTVNQVRIGARKSNTFPSNIYLKRFAYYPYRLPDTTLQTITGA